MAEETPASVLSQIEARYLPQRQVPLSRRGGRRFQSASFGLDPELERAPTVGAGKAKRETRPRVDIATPTGSVASSPRQSGVSSGNAGMAALAGVGTRVLGSLVRQGVRALTDNGSGNGGGTGTKPVADTTAQEMTHDFGSFGGDFGGAGDALGFGQEAMHGFDGLGDGLEILAAPEAVDAAKFGAEALEGADAFSKMGSQAGGLNLSGIGVNIGNMGAGMLANYLAGQAAGPRSMEKSLGASIGSTVGAAALSFVPVIGPFLGAFIGNMIGGSFGAEMPVGGGGVINYRWDEGGTGPAAYYWDGDNGFPDDGLRSFGDRFMAEMSNYLAANGLEWDPAATALGRDFGFGYQSRSESGAQTQFGWTTPAGWYGTDLKAPISSYSFNGSLLGRGPMPEWATEESTMLELMFREALDYMLAHNMVRRQGQGYSLDQYKADAQRQMAEFNALMAPPEGWQDFGPEYGGNDWGGPSAPNPLGLNYAYGASYDAESNSWKAPGGTAEPAPQVQIEGQQQQAAPPPPSQQAQQPAQAPTAAATRDTGSATQAAAAPQPSATQAATSPQPSATQTAASQPSAPPPITIAQPISRREGGYVPMPTPGVTEPVPATLHTGEFVMRPEAVAFWGPEFMAALNQGKMPEPGAAPAIPGAPYMGMIEPPPNPQFPTRSPSPFQPRMGQAQPGAQGQASPSMVTIRPQMGAPQPPRPVAPPMPGTAPGAMPRPPGPGPMAALPQPGQPMPMPPGAGGGLPGIPNIPGPMPRPPTTPMLPPMDPAAGQQEMGTSTVAPPMPRAPVMRRPAGGGGGGGRGEMGADVLNGLSLAAIRGEGPTSDPRLAGADRNIRGAMGMGGGKPAYREGGLVTPMGAPPIQPGGPGPAALMQMLAPMLAAGGGGMGGHEMGENEMGEDGDGMDGDEGDPLAPMGVRRPYADVARSPSPFMEPDPRQGISTDGVLANFKQMPPEAQQAALTVFGADPMVASALLQLLGPAIEPLIRDAMKMAGMQGQMQGMGMGAAPGMGAPPPPGMMG